MVTPRGGCALPRLPHLLLLVLISCCLLPRYTAAQSSPAYEAQLLLKIKRAWSDPPVLASWNASSSASHCAWPYVRCDAFGRVTGLRLANANVTGPFPDAVGDLTGLTHLDVSNNNINDTFPTALYRCGSLQYLNLSQNYFAGSLPDDTGSGLAASLITLDISENQMTGEIPAELGAVPALSFLDLSSNKLSGDIPPALAKPSLTFLNLSSNQLSGEVPAGLATEVYDQSFLNNPGLCTAAGYLAGVRSCSAGPPQDLSSGGVSGAFRTGLFVAVGVLLAVIAAFALFVAFVARDAKKRRRLATQKDWKITPFQVLDFGEAAILRGLTKDNLVGGGGSGRVYRVAYTNRRDGTAGQVAVKQIRVSAAAEKQEREFEAEAGVLGSVRHNNIVRLLCCLSGPDSRLLVYEYRENGSLDTWLHGAGAGGVANVPSAQRRRARLDWPTRIQVAVASAKGLCYMHHECTPPVVHRNVKTSSILLDSEFQARIADFGLATSAVAGSSGYMAPECGQTRELTEKTDVYSFGVVLLELTTGKKANDGGEHGFLADWARHRNEARENIADAKDKFADEVEAVSVLGVQCTSSSPSLRPDMNLVLQKLLECSRLTHQKTKAMGMEEISDFDSIV